MYLIADAFLALRDFVYGTLHGALSTGYRWMQPLYPWSAGIGILGAFANPAQAGMMALSGVLIVPGMIAAAGAAWGTLTGGISAVHQGLQERRYHRAQDAEARGREPEMAPPAPQRAPRAQPEAPSRAPQPTLPAAPETGPAALPDAKTAKELGLKGDAGPNLAFYDSRPTTRISEGELQGLLQEKCARAPVLSG